MVYGKQGNNFFLIVQKNIIFLIDITNFARISRVKEFSVPVVPSLWSEKMKEKYIEHQLVMKVKAMGGICPKLVSPGMDGMPDRMALLPGGHIGFVEVKAPGGKPRKLQALRHRLLTGLGFKVFILDGTEQIPGIIDGIKGGNDGCDQTEKR